MGLFDFLKKKVPKPNTMFIEGIGDFIYEDSFLPSFDGEIRIGLGYPITISFPVETENSEVSEYQIAYFKSIKESSKFILEDATARLKLKIDKESIQIKCILIPDVHDSRFNIESEVVIIHLKKNALLNPSGITSLVIRNFKIDELIRIE
jgi:hypothetical protein